MLENELLFLLEDLFDYFLVILSELLDVVGVLGSDFLECGHAVTKALPFRSCLVLEALILLLPLLSALKELAAGAFLELRLEPLLPYRRSLTRSSGLCTACLLRSATWIAVGFGQEVTGVISATCLNNRSEQCLLVITLSEGVSSIGCWPLRFRALKALFEAVDLILQALQCGLLASNFRSITR